MNNYRRVLVHLSDAALSQKVCALAVQVAAAQGAELRVVYSSNSDVCKGVAEIAQAKGVRARCDAISGGIAPLVACARISDLFVMSQPWSAGTGSPSVGFASQLLISVSCPVLFVPAPAALGTTCGSRVLVSWSPGRESARALRDSLPLLQRADQVQLRTYGAGHAPADDELADACEYLKLHGVDATYSAERMGDIDFSQRMLTPTVVDASVTELLLSHATDTDADLIVMGGYGHSRAHEVLLGGVTKSMLTSMTLPVLMSH